MKASRPTGLGEPEISGKRSLFQPPDDLDQKEKKEKQKSISEPEQKTPPPTKQGEKTHPPKRVRTTIDLTREALKILQELQQSYRLETGRVLPLWKVVSDAIIYFGDTKGGKR